MHFIGILAYILEVEMIYTSKKAYTIQVKNIDEMIVYF